jgi:hypothetical protein
VRAARLVAYVLLAGGLWAAVSAPAAAGQVEGLSTHTATRAGAGPIRLDGDLSDPAWRDAGVIANFVQREPNEGAPPTHRTEARVLYDDAAIYIGVRAFDSDPDRILAFLTRRDTDSASDWIRVLIDSYHDRRTAYEFIVNPAGVKRDKYRYNDNNDDESWDAVWDVAVLRDREGWSAEFRIPYSQLRFGGGADGTLGFAISREVARLNETSTWPLLPRGASGYVSSFGELAGVVRPPGGKRLEVAPYVLGQIQTSPEQPGNPLLKTPDPGGSVGLDMKYAVTPALSFTGTVNPDFGQVEADPAEVNLSAFETFFNERRPFFVEGSGTYQFDCDDCSIFYSRRIGRAPRGRPDATGGYITRPGQSTILGAGKLTGRVGPFAVGTLAAVTQEEEARLAFGDTRLRTPVEPQTLYTVSRVRREFSDQSFVGLVFTSASRGRADGLSFLPDSAITTGLDYDWRLGQQWSLNGTVTGTRVAGSATAITALQQSNVHSFQRPDADHVEVDPLAESLSGHGGSMAFGKIAGDKVRGNVSLAYKSPGFDVNELGFQRRADEIKQRSWVQRRWMNAGKYVRTRMINFNQWSFRNYDGDLLDLGGNFNTHWTFVNQWSTGGGFNLNARTFDDRVTRGGPGAYRNPNVNGWYYFNTDDTRVVSFHWDGNFFVDRPTGSGSLGRSYNFFLGPRLQVRPTSALSGEVGIGQSRSLEDAQWVTNLTENGRTRYVLGRLNQTTTNMTLRLSYTLTPNLSVQLYGQPFASSGRYEHYKELVNGRAAHHAARYAPYDYAGNADFTVLSFRTTNVLRWEFKPGSTMFVVWQQGREGFRPDSSFRFGRDYGDIFATPSSNTVLVKLSYWLNP